MIHYSFDFTSVTEKIVTDWSEKAKINLYVKRDDLVHPSIIGNKWRKLKYNLQEAKRLSCKTLLTFGGAFSNHVHATAAAAKEYGFESIAIIRGEELNSESNPTLRFAKAHGMALRFVSRADFRLFKDNPELLKMDLSGVYLLPEGGTNDLAIKGCAEIPTEIQVDFDYLITSIGTGGTMAGLIKGAKGKGEIIGVSALKGDFMIKNAENLLSENLIHETNYRVLTAYHFGGYGRANSEIIQFINDTKNLEGLKLDPIYTGKTFFAVRDMARKNYFPIGSNVVFLHTGGLQGVDGFNQKHNNKIEF